MVTHGQRLGRTFRSGPPGPKGTLVSLHWSIGRKGKSFLAFLGSYPRLRSHTCLGESPLSGSSCLWRARHVRAGREKRGELGARIEESRQRGRDNQSVSKRRPFTHRGKNRRSPRTPAFE